VRLARELGAEVVSLWAGTPRDLGEDREVLWERLCDGLLPVLDSAAENGVRIAFEPEPGMFVERPGEYRELKARLGKRGEELGLCLDVGHCLCTDDLPVERIVREFADDLIHVHLDDIAGGVHDHRMFGEGDLDLAATLQALTEIDYRGMAAVELSRDSHRGAWAAAEAMQHLKRART
jgi:sugar phosphate isomerase/epimerase